MKYLSFVFLIGVMSACMHSSALPIEGVTLEYPQKEYRFSFDTATVEWYKNQQVVRIEGVVRGSDEELNRNRSRGNLFYQRIRSYPFQLEVLSAEGTVLEQQKIHISRYRIVGGDEAACQLHAVISTPLEKGYLVRVTSLKKW